MRHRTGWAVVPRRREDRPYGEPDLIVADTPGQAEVLDNAEPAAADRERRRMTSVRNRRAAAVAYRHLDRASIHVPSDLEALAGQRIGVQDGVAEQLADDQRRITHGVVEDSRRAQLIGERTARKADARWRARQVDDFRRAHLPSPPGVASQRFLCEPLDSDARTDATGNRPNPT